MKYIVLPGRILYAAIFLMSVPEDFTSKTISYAAAKGVPLAPMAVPAAGAIAFLGGLSILLGYKARLGAWLIAIFLVPMTLMIHNFRAIADPVQARMQMINLMKNLSMLGAALMITHLGPGPLSLDVRKDRDSSSRA
ncbi:MAG: DoxX family protein [Nitrospiraceae bacterium]|nr:DoxX family protein [Nitrospiraceae bacterium]